VLALRRLDIEYVTAELVEGWTLDQEREVYAIRNTTFPKHPMDLYKALLVASEIIAGTPLVTPRYPGRCFP
jgi:hypothetical protein